MAKTAKTTKEETPVAEVERVTVRDLARDLGVSPATVRKHLRDLVADGKIEHDPKTRWGWDEGSDELEETVQLLQAKMSASDAESEDDEEDDEDE